MVHEEVFLMDLLSRGSGRNCSGEAEDLLQTLPASPEQLRPHFFEVNSRSCFQITFFVQNLLRHVELPDLAPFLYDGVEVLVPVGSVGGVAKLRRCRID